MTARRRPAAGRLGLKGSLWIAVGDHDLGGHGRIGLLRAVAEHGSITQAAKAFGMSYKAAWDAIDAMNRRSGTPLVERVTGGRGGGATRLTAHGQRLVERYGEIDALHQRFLALLERDSMNLERPLSLLDVINMKTSARNQYLGTVSAVRAGAVNDEIELRLSSGAALVAVVTQESTAALGLQIGTPAIALVKATSVLLATGLGAARVSARNQWAGTVREVRPGAVNAEVRLELEGGESLTAVVSRQSVRDLRLAVGRRATALVKASDVILAVVS